MDMANAVNALSLQYDPTPFLTEWQMRQQQMNPALNPAQPPFKPPAEQGWYDTFMAAQGTTPAQPPAATPPTATPAFGPAQIAALQALMPKQQMWPPAPAVAPRGPSQVQLGPVVGPAPSRTPLVPSFAGLFGR